MILVLFLLVFLLGVGLAIGVTVLAMLSLLITLGIVSSSTLVALLRRSAADGLRILFLQLGTVAGAPVGVGATFLWDYLLEKDWTSQQVILTGIGLGATAGLVAALLFNLAWSKVLTILFSIMATKSRGVGSVVP